MNAVTLIAAFVLVILPGVASAAPHVELVNAATTIETKDGALVAVPFSGTARPGQRIRYTIVAKNTGDRAASNLVPVVMIPKSERYIGGSAGAAAEFSVDGGKSWSHAPMIKVTKPDGTTTLRPAAASEYDALRWPATSPLAPGSKATFAYDVTIE